MQKIIFALLIFITACGPVTPVVTPEPTPMPTAELIAPVIRPSTPMMMTPKGFIVRYHPDGPLFAGDVISIEVITPAGFDSSGQQILISGRDGKLAESAFSGYGIGGRMQATFWWIWDTQSINEGIYPLDFSIQPVGIEWRETIVLLPTEKSPDRDSAWAVSTTDCCTINYITNTDAERDITSLVQMSEDVTRNVKAKLGVAETETIPIVFMPRTLGHGGFASDSIYVSSLDRNYAGSTTSFVLHHEMVHWVDATLGGDFRPTILLEGLAVYLSDGHFKTEPIRERAAALIDMGLYIPLRDLVNNFYTSQHEIGYLEGAALIDYLVAAYGWDSYNSFYRDIHIAPDQKQSDAINNALVSHFNVNLDQTEEGFIAFLKSQSVTDDHRTDLRLSIAFYDAVRRYQQALDPSAYFLTAWLPDGTQMRQRGIVADFTRHPDSTINQGIENLLVEADRALRAGDYDSAELKINTINVFLDILDNLGK